MVQKSQARRENEKDYSESTRETLSIQQMTVGQYLDKFLESEQKALRDGWKLCEETFLGEMNRIEEDILHRAELKNEDFRARIRQAEVGYKSDLQHRSRTQASMKRQ